MSTFIIDDNKKSNTHKRDNFLVNNRNISVYRSYKAKLYDPASYPNNILVNYNKELIVQNPATQISPDFTLKTTDTISQLNPGYLDFGIPNTVNVFSFPPLFLRYFL